jgi:diaminopimelate epimerase
MRFYKYHALGNDYIILPPDEFSITMTGEVKKVAEGVISEEIFD